MSKCKSWHEAHPPRAGADGVCYGTKECEPCACGGDETKCDFYPEKRQSEKSELEAAQEKIRQLERQIDRMLMQMHGDCGVCKHKEAIGAPCVGCLTSRRNRPAWEYEDIPEDHGKEHPHD